MATLAAKVIEHERVPLRLEAFRSGREALRDADFVVLTFADRSAYFRNIDCRVSARYGVRMCSGDTIGPGGVFRVLREFPRILAYCRMIETLCPDAWVINYVNPTAANGLGLRRFAPRLRSFALCDGLHMPHVKKRYARRAGIIRDDSGWSARVDRDFDFRIAGPNHFTWLLRAAYRGRDVTPAIADALRKQAAAETDGGDVGSKALFNASITYALYRVFGFVPTCTAHTKEYVRFWQGTGRLPEPIPPLTLWNVRDRYRSHASMWRQVRGFNRGSIPIGEFRGAFQPDHATDVIESMWAGLKKPFFINTANQGAVPNMPGDAFLELLCDATMDRVTPRPVGDAPVGLRGLWQQVLDTHELSVEAAVTCDRAILRRALLCDPLVNSPADADAIISRLLRAERSALPAAWRRAGQGT
jgi:alpha-galactosidase